jgi:hypothetical protein
MVRGRAKRWSSGEVDVHVEALGLEGGKAIGNDLKAGAHGVQVVESFLETKVA